MTDTNPTPCAPATIDEEYEIIPDAELADHDPEGDAYAKGYADGYKACAIKQQPTSPASDESCCNPSSCGGVHVCQSGSGQPSEIRDNGEDVRAGYDMGFDAGKAFALSNNSFCSSSVSDKIVCPSELGDFELQLNAEPKFRRASLRPVMLDEVAALFINLDHPKWLPIATLFKAGLLATSKPVAVSLEKCTAVAAALWTNWETHTARTPTPREITKAVLNAVGVKYE